MDNLEDGHEKVIDSKYRIERSKNSIIILIINSYTGV